MNIWQEWVVHACISRQWPMSIIRCRNIYYIEFIANAMSISAVTCKYWCYSLQYTQWRHQLYFFFGHTPYTGEVELYSSFLPLLDLSLRRRPLYASVLYSLPIRLTLVWGFECVTNTCRNSSGYQKRVFSIPALLRVQFCSPTRLFFSVCVCYFLRVSLTSSCSEIVYVSFNPQPYLTLN